ncbi:hypothetical protein H0X06_03820 [Candidatus Dependentiae bacterium]|nr:hypothetical protein [Candidatus Dependentiae bacterium]
MSRIRYYAVFILASSTLCQGTPTTKSQAHHAGVGTIQAAVSIASTYCAYRIFKEARATHRIAGIADGIGSLVLGVLYHDKLSASTGGLDSLAYINLIGLSLWGAYKSGVSSIESFKTVYRLRNPQEEPSSAEYQSFSPATEGTEKSKEKNSKSIEENNPL